MLSYSTHIYIQFVYERYFFERYFLHGNLWVGLYCVYLNIGLWLVVPLWVCFDFPFLSLGWLWDPLGSPWTTLEHLGSPWRAPWSTWWYIVGFRQSCTSHSEQMALKYKGSAQKAWLPGSCQSRQSTNQSEARFGSQLSIPLSVGPGQGWLEFRQTSSNSCFRINNGPFCKHRHRFLNQNKKCSLYYRRIIRFQ